MPMQTGTAAYVTIRHLFISLMFSSSECEPPAQERFLEESASIFAKRPLKTYACLSDHTKELSILCCYSLVQVLMLCQPQAAWLIRKHNQPCPVRIRPYSKLQCYCATEKVCSERYCTRTICQMCSKDRVAQQLQEPSRGRRTHPPPLRCSHSRFAGSPQSSPGSLHLYSWRLFPTLSILRDTIRWASENSLWCTVHCNKNQTLYLAAVTL